MSACEVSSHHVYLSLSLCQAVYNVKIICEYEYYSKVRRPGLDDIIIHCKMLTLGLPETIRVTTSLNLHDMNVHHTITYSAIDTTSHLSHATENTS